MANRPLFLRTLRVKWWNWRWAAAVLRPQRNQRPSSTGSASHWSVKCAFMKGCKSQKSLAVIHNQCFTWKNHLMKMSRCLYRFLHKHPEDTSEVPNGFLSDINPVSTSAEHLFGLTDVSVGTAIVSCISSFCHLEFHAYNQQCLSGHLSQGSKGFGQIPVRKSWLLFCGPRQHWRQGTARQKNPKTFYMKNVYLFSFHLRNDLLIYSD